MTEPNHPTSTAPDPEFGLGLHHVQLAIPPGSEDACRAFYIGILGMHELTKPPVLAARGGLWVEGDGLEIHLGVEEDFRPSRKGLGFGHRRGRRLLGTQASDGDCDEPARCSLGRQGAGRCQGIEA